MTFTFTPATWPWLLRHELRLAWRNISRTSLWLIVIGGGLLWACLHLVAWLTLSKLGPLSGAIAGTSSAASPPMATLVTGAALWFAISLMFSQAILLSITALFDRGDFDLLLSSPMPTRTVFIVRGMGVAISSVFLYLLLFTPFAHMGLITGHAHLLAIYPALISIGLFVSALGMLLTLTLVRVLGARRARMVGQLIGALVGAMFFLASQVQTMLSTETRAGITSTFKQWIAVDGPLAPDSAIWFPLRAMLGEWLPLLIVIGVGIGGFWLVVSLTYKRFLAGTQESVTGQASKKLPAVMGGSIKFRPGLMMNVLIKEWKLIVRDPNLIAQTFLQMLYLLPMIFIFFRRQDMTLLVMPATIMLASTLAGSLAWITIAAEDAPELIGVAPVQLARIRWMKALAAVMPVWILVSPVLFYLLFTTPLYAAAFAFFIAGGTISAGLIQIWYPRQGDRKNMKKRGQGNMVINFIEGISALGWAGTSYAMLAAPLWAPLGLLLALTGPSGAWLLGKSRREQGVLA